MVVKKKVSAEGLAKLAQMMKQMPGQEAQKVLSQLAQSSPGVAAAVKSVVLTFDRLRLLDDRSLSVLVRQVERKTLAMALKGESQEFRMRVFRSMTGRAADLLRDEIEALGKQPVSKVGEAQKRVVQTAEQLSTRGDLRLPQEG